MSFCPADAEVFEFLDYQFNEASNELVLRYRLDDHVFAERLIFPGARDNFSADERSALERCFFLTHLLAGISYFKAAVPPQIIVSSGQLSPAMAALLNSVYRNGLGEFAYENRLELHRREFFEVSGAAVDAPVVSLARQPVVPLGGGKDSLVSVELLRHTQPQPMTIAVGQSSLIRDVSQHTGLAHIGIERQLDPLLFRLNRQGAYNGHVPITAILAGIMLCGAVICGYDTVVMSNEDSANVANVVLGDGFEVNHQYSKSLEFERAFAQLVQQEVLPGFEYFSLLRPWSELKIAARFSQSERYDAVFSSCNRNFQIQGDGPSGRWCGDCPKCRFVFLALAPFMSRPRLLSIIGHDLLDDDTQLAGFEELLGLRGHKPFECVGEVEESQAALAAIADSPDWQQSGLIKVLAGQLQRPIRPLSAWLDSAAEHRIPERYRVPHHAP